MLSTALGATAPDWLLLAILTFRSSPTRPEATDLCQPIAFYMHHCLVPGSILTMTSAVEIRRRPQASATCKKIPNSILPMPVVTASVKAVLLAFPPTEPSGDWQLALDLSVEGRRLRRSAST